MQQSSPHHPLSSKDNNAVKWLRGLADPKNRKREQAFLIEGVKMVEEALRDGLGVTRVVASPNLIRHHGKGVLKLAEQRGVDIIWITERLMDALAESKTPQPVMAAVAMSSHSDDELFRRPGRLIVATHELQDPGNLGTIIRTAEAAGASGVAISTNSADAFNAKTVRASMGSILRLPIVSAGHTKSFLEMCRQRGFRTVAAVLTGKKTHYDVDFTGPTAVLVGQEGAGLPGDLISDIDERVRIPMAGPTDSLNVAIATAVILYEVIRQRRHAG